jgi:hypothetical protein
LDIGDPLHLKAGLRFDDDYAMAFAGQPRGFAVHRRQGFAGNDSNGTCGSESDTKRHGLETGGPAGNVEIIANNQHVAAIVHGLGNAATKHEIEIDLGSRGSGDDGQQVRSLRADAA